MGWVALVLADVSTPCTMLSVNVQVNPLVLASSSSGLRLELDPVTGAPRRLMTAAGESVSVAVRATLITGGGSGIKLGHHLVVSKDTPLCNAWLTLLQGSGIDLERHGDSSGVVKELIA